MAEICNNNKNSATHKTNVKIEVAAESDELQTMARSFEPIDFAVAVDAGIVQELLRTTNSEACRDLYSSHKVLRDLRNLPMSLETPVGQLITRIAKTSFGGGLKAQLSHMATQLPGIARQAEAPKETLANLTIVQALYRRVQPGERKALALRCRKGLEKDLSGGHPKLLAALASVCGDVSAAPGMGTG